MNELDNIIANLVNSLVKDEWEAVDGYNSAIATLSDYDDERAKKIIKVLEDIRDEEYVHIGQLESCLSMTDGNPTEDIDEGSEEGFEQLELPEEDDEEVESVTIDESKKSDIDDMDIDEVKKRLKAVGFDDTDFMGKSDRQIRAMLKLYRRGRGDNYLRKWSKERREKEKPTKSETLLKEREDDELEAGESLNETKIKATGNMVGIPIEDAPKSSLSEKEMKKIICTMIDKYDASEEETFDEIQSSDPTITRETVHRLYKMCNKRNESLEKEKKSSFDEMWGELDKMEDNQ